MADEYCRRCDAHVEPVHREWRYGPDSINCPRCGADLGVERP